MYEMLSQVSRFMSGLSTWWLMALALAAIMALSILYRDTETYTEVKKASGLIVSEKGQRSAKFKNKDTKEKDGKSSPNVCQYARKSDAGDGLKCPPSHPVATGIDDMGGRRQCAQSVRCAKRVGGSAYRSKPDDLGPDNPPRTLKGCKYVKKVDMGGGNWQCPSSFPLPTGLDWDDGRKSGRYQCAETPKCVGAIDHLNTSGKASNDTAARPCGGYGLVRRGDACVCDPGMGVINTGSADKPKCECDYPSGWEWDGTRCIKKQMIPAVQTKEEMWEQFKKDNPFFRNF